MSKTIKINTITNYSSFLIKILGALISTKILLKFLSIEEYGQWALLWCLYGYTLLVDFGLGVAVQKSSAEYQINSDINKLNRIISTTFFSYSIVSILLVVFSYLVFNGTFPLPPIKELLEQNRNSFLYFSIGTAIIFPTGIFSEVLVGLGKMYLRNTIRIFFYVCNIVGVFALYYFQRSFEDLTIFTVLNHFIANFLNYILCKYHLRKLNISLRFFETKTFKELSNFSVYAYIIIFSNIIFYNTDQIVISSLVSASAVGLFQLGSRIPLFFRNISQIFQENLFPQVIKNIKLKKNINETLKALPAYQQWTALVSLSAGFFLFNFTERLLFIWIEMNDAIILNVAYLGIIYFIANSILKSLFDPILLASGHGNKLSKILILEGVINLVASIILIKNFGIIGAFLGSLTALLIVYTSFYMGLIKTCMPFSFYKLIIFPLFRASKSLVIPSLGLYLIKLYFNPESLLGIILALSSYLCMMLVFNTKIIKEIFNIDIESFYKRKRNIGYESVNN